MFRCTIIFQLNSFFGRKCHYMYIDRCPGTFQGLLLCQTELTGWTLPVSQCPSCADSSHQTCRWTQQVSQSHSENNCSPRVVTGGTVTVTQGRIASAGSSHSLSGRMSQTQIIIKVLERQWNCIYCTPRYYTFITATW